MGYVRTALKARRGGFRRIQTLAGGADAFSSRLDQTRLAFDPLRRHTAIYGRWPDAPSEFQLSRRRLGGGFGRARRLPVGTAVALDRRGRARATGTTTAGLLFAAERAGEGLIPQRLVAHAPTGAVHQSPSGIAVAADGDVLIVWQSCVTAQGCTVMSRRRSAAGRFGRIRTLSRPPLASNFPVAPPVLAMNARGEAIVAWGAQRTGVPGEIQFVRVSGAGTRVGTVGTLAPGYNPAVAINSRGAAVVAWESASPTGPLVGAAAIRPRRAHGRPVTLGPGTNVDVAIDSRGRATAAWTDHHHTPHKTLAATYD